MHVQSLRRSFVLCLTLGGLAAAGCANPNAAATGTSSGSSASTAGGGMSLAADQVVAQADGVTITGADVDKGTAGDVYKLSEQLYETRRGWAENEIAKRLLERKAHEIDPKMSYEEFLAKEVDSKVPVTSDATAQMYYKQNNAHFQKKPDGSVASFDDLKDQIKHFLDQQNKNSAEQEYVRKLMDDSHMKITLAEPEPPTMQVSADDDPAENASADAPVTIIEFADFQCPACRQAALQMPQLLDKYKGKVRLVFRDYPLSKHPDAFPSAIAAWCANDQSNDKYWTYHDLLFQKQNDGLSQDKLKQYARDAGLDGAKFDTCFAAQMADPNSKAAQEIKHDMQDGDTAGVTATPTFYVNGKLTSGFNMESLSQLVDNELKKKGAS